MGSGAPYRSCPLIRLFCSPLLQKILNESCELGPNPVLTPSAKHKYRKTTVCGGFSFETLELAPTYSSLQELYTFWLFSRLLEK